jgi:HEAT repeat protein
MMHSRNVLAAILLTGLTAHAQAPATNAPPPDPYVLLAGFDFGQDRAPLNQIDEAIKAATGDAARRAEIEGKLVGLLSQPSLPVGAQNYICLTLSVIGGEKSVPALADLLGDERKADLARLALERIPHASAGAALRSALPKTAGRTRIGLAQSLGVRRDEAAVPLLAPLLKESDPATRSAAAHALGLIGGERATTALLATGRLDVPAIADAAMRCADQLPAQGAKAAAAIYRTVMTNAPAYVGEAALVGLARVAPDEAGARLLALFDSGDEAAVARAIRLARRVQVPTFARAAADRLPKLPAGAQVAVLALLGDIGQAEARPAVLACLSSAEESVRLAAVDALGALPGDATAVARLAALAATGATAEKKAAARNLIRVTGPEADKDLRAGAHAGSVPERLACIAALGERQAAGTDQFLLGLRGDGDPEIRRSALRALDKVAGPEWYGPTLAWLLAAKDEAEAREAERVVIRLGEKAPKAVEELLAADAQATDVGRERLARCLARRGGDAALQQVRAYAAAPNEALATAAVRALGTWPNAAPLPDLLAVVEKGGEARRVALAVQGALQLLAADPARSAEAKAELVGQLLAKAQQPEARKLLISALGEYPSGKARDLAAGLVDDPQCGAEAQAALQRIRNASMQPPGLTASHNAGELKNATDKNPGTRWTTGTGMAPGQWLELDLHATCLIRRIVLDTTGSAGDFPRKYQVFVGDAPAPAGEPAVTGEGNGPVTEIVFDPPRRGRHVRIVQQGRVDNLYWSVHELKVEADLPAETVP